jgi:hypothetical protein
MNLLGKPATVRGGLFEQLARCLIDDQERLRPRLGVGGGQVDPLANNCWGGVPTPRDRRLPRDAGFLTPLDRRSGLGLARRARWGRAELRLAECAWRPPDRGW